MADSTEIWDIASQIGTTAVVAAACRAVEHHRDDSIVSDPYAEPLVEAARLPFPIPTRPAPDAANWRAMSDLLGTRGRFFDDVLEQAVDDGIRQVVILAAGLDTRAQRLGWPSGTVVFEIEQPAVLDFKMEVLDTLGAAASCDHRPVGHDLRGDWAAALDAAGFDRSSPSVWIAEGLLYYLTPAAQQGLLETVDMLAAPGSRWATEDDPAFLDRMNDPEARAASESMGVDLRILLEAGSRPDPESWLLANRWVVESRRLRTAAAGYGRVLDPLTDRTNGSFVLTSSRKV
ncbi:class I SAM-dependent methyltransferase [Pseudonocardia kongjuensis]|uniref:S-adenosyl-L-methionine-dependent methyltransferase n=1 Tax=Pseudonocardia kongjuensis TaxID=102227 RepID=A0ABN1XYR8_9PSEU